MVECTGLENRRGLTPTVGSNPTSSATAHNTLVTMDILQIFALFSGAFRGVRIPQTAVLRKFTQILPKVWEPLFDGSSLVAVVGLGY